MKKILFSILFLIFSLLCLYSFSVQKNLSDEILRLHIIANSDSEYDQNIKLKVRDKISESVGAEFLKIKDKKEYRRILIEKIDEIQNMTDSVLADSNVGYKSKVSFEKLYVPRKKYNSLILPEGSYEGVVVRLGNACGKNWWCVVYPPLCFSENSVGNLTPEAKEYLKNNLSAESYSLITEEGINIQYKFKIIETFQKIKKLTAKNKLR